VSLRAGKPDSNNPCLKINKCFPLPIIFSKVLDDTVKRQNRGSLLNSTSKINYLIEYADTGRALILKYSNQIHLSSVNFYTLILKQIPLIQLPNIPNIFNFIIKLTSVPFLAFWTNFLYSNIVKSIQDHFYRIHNLNY
jgi:hypothetical protein